MVGEEGRIDCSAALGSGAGDKVVVLYNVGTPILVLPLQRRTAPPQDVMHVMPGLVSGSPV